ncbi:MAG: PorV/PorQ family protein [candidate division Zixibacteria bacterium]|nr:PorV/PorQ family protein [candidate division Zixibacteria bacterium]
MKKLVLSAWLAVGSISSIAFGREGSSGTSSLFLLGAGTRAMGMGGSFVSVADDASAVFWNPAGLARLSFGELGFSHVTLPEGSEYDFAGLAYPTVKAGSFALGFLRVGTDGIFSRDERAVDMGSVSFSETQILLAYGHSLFKFIHVGGSFKLYGQSLAGFSANAAGADVGVLVEPHEGLFFGVNAQDVVSSDLKLKDSKESIPRNFKAGASYLLPLRQSLVGIRAAVDAEKSEDAPVAWHAGAEMSYRGSFFIRGGYDREDLTFGVGLAYNRLGLDYAFKPQPEGLAASHRFGFSFRFGTPVREREKIAREKKQREERENYLRANRARLEEYRSKAEIFAAAGQNDSALAYLRLTLGIDPENEALKREAARLEHLLQVEKETKEQEALSLRLRQEALESGRTEYALGNFKNALTLLEEQVRLGDSEFAELSGRIQKSLDSAKNLLDSTGWAAFNRKEFENALAAWEKMGTLDPSDTTASARFKMAAGEIKVADLLKKGIADFEAGRLLAAQESFEQALKLRPAEPAAQAYLQKIRAAAEARTRLEDLQKDPEAWRLYNEGLAAYTAGEYQKALDVWESLLLRYPNNEALLRNVADAKKRLK